MEWLAVAGWVPWIVTFLIFTRGIREPRPLPDEPQSHADSSSSLPSVTIVVPARDEAHNIAACLASLAGQRYPDFSIVVVNDRSTDETGARAQAVPAGNAREIQLLNGEPLPAGWFGKPWACWQGARVTKSDLVLFTDADTLHTPSLLIRTVAALEEDRADALSLQGWQELGSFGERLVQPQIFALLGLRYRRLDRPVEREDSSDAIANGQFILMDRRGYERIGGHEAVRGEVVEDLRLAQLLTEAGLRLTLRGAEEGLCTRMYHSLGEVVDGWTKNLAVGARQSMGRLAPIALPGILAFLLLLWIFPPVILSVALALMGLGAEPTSGLLFWAGGTTSLGTLLWIVLYRRFGVAWPYAVLYPLGAAVTSWIVVRSWLRGERRVVWKGRRYRWGEIEAREEAE